MRAKFRWKPAVFSAMAVLAVSQVAGACPDFNGRYVDRSQSQPVYYFVKQNQCAQVDITSSTDKDFKKVDEEMKIRVGTTQPVTLKIGRATMKSAFSSNGTLVLDLTDIYERSRGTESRAAYILRMIISKPSADKARIVTKLGVSPSLMATVDDLTLVRY